MTIKTVPSDLYYGRMMRMPPQKLPALVSKPAKEAKESKGALLVREEWLPGVDFEPAEEALAEKEAAAEQDEDDEDQSLVQVAQRVESVADFKGDAEAAGSEGAKLLEEESEHQREDKRLVSAQQTAMIPADSVPLEENPSIQGWNDVCAARLTRMLVALNHERNMAKWNARELTQDPTLSFFKVRATYLLLLLNELPCFFRSAARSGSIVR